jgi:hypothetical protein
VTAYSASTIAYPSTCASISQSRTCTNGTLSGSYTNGSCTETGQPCTGTGALSWVSLNDTQTVTAYQSSTEPGPTAGNSPTCVNTGNGQFTTPVAIAVH